MVLCVYSPIFRLVDKCLNPHIILWLGQIFSGMDSFLTGQLVEGSGVF